MTRKRFLLPLPWIGIAGVLIGLGLVNLVQYGAYKSSEDHTILATQTCAIESVDPDDGDNGTITLDCGDGLTLETSHPEEYMSIISEMLETEEPQQVTCVKRRGNLTQDVHYWCGTEQEDS
jgi:hypothetical protein